MPVRRLYSHTACRIQVCINSPRPKFKYADSHRQFDLLAQIALHYIIALSSTILNIRPCVYWLLACRMPYLKAFVCFPFDFLLPLSVHLSII